MSDGFTEVSSTGWLQRLGQAFMGVLIGLLLFVVSFPLLFWNEGRAVKTAQGLEEGEKKVVSVAADKVDPANQDRLVHISGLATTDQELRDPVFGVAEKAIRLQRNVEMFQWVEKKEETRRKKFGGGEETVTNYTYSKQWSNKLVNSQNFREPAGHENPGQMPYPSWEEWASMVTVGAFRLSDSLERQISKSEALPVDTAALERVSSADKARFTVNNGGFFLGDPSTPKVGDVRVNFLVTRPTTVSLLAKQVGDSFEPFKTSVSGAPLINDLRLGSMSAVEMFQQAQAENNMMTWLLRLVGYVLMAAGIGMVFKPLVVMADVIPFIGNLLGMGVAFVAGLIALPLTLTTIAIGWIFYRPLLGVALLAAAVAVTVGIVMLVRSRRRVPASV